MAARAKRRAPAGQAPNLNEEPDDELPLQFRCEKKGRYAQQATEREEMKEGLRAASPASETTEGEQVSEPGSPGKSSEPEISYKPRLDLLKEGDPGSLTGRPMRLYADGIFDLFHYGHAKALEQAKKSYPNTYLMVGCCSDEVTHTFKGITVMNEIERYESLRHCKWVDEVIEDAPWVVTDEFLEKHQIDFVCHDALPYIDTSGQADDGDVYSHLKKKGKFLETERTEGISTSEVINRIIVHYDDYVLRQLQRGYSAKEMNVTQWKETELYIKKFAQSTSKTIAEVQQGFLSVFNRDSQFRCRLRQQRKQTWTKINDRITELARVSFC